MNDRIKHRLYDEFLEGTPISFESVTDEQFAQMQSTLLGFSIVFSCMVTDIRKVICDALEPVVLTINNVLNGSKNNKGKVNGHTRKNKRD